MQFYNSEERTPATYRGILQDSHYATLVALFFGEVRPVHTPGWLNFAPVNVVVKPITENGETRMEKSIEESMEGGPTLQELRDYIESSKPKSKGNRQEGVGDGDVQMEEVDGDGEPEPETKEDVDKENTTPPPEPKKRGRGRPKGRKNNPKPLQGKKNKNQKRPKSNPKTPPSAKSTQAQAPRHNEGGYDDEQDRTPDDEGSWIPHSGTASPAYTTTHTSNALADISWGEAQIYLLENPAVWEEMGKIIKGGLYIRVNQQATNQVYSAH